MWSFLLVLFASASSLISAAAAAYPGPGHCVINKAGIYNIIEAGDHQEMLAAALGNCWSYAPRLHGEILREIVRHKRFGSLELFLTRMTFPEGQRDEALTEILAFAIESGRFFLVDRILKEHFTIDRSRYRFFCWPQPWNTSRIGSTIRSHPEHAGGLRPTPADFAMMAGEAEGVLLLAFARYCASVTEQAGLPHPKGAGPTSLLDGLVRNGVLSDGAMAATVANLVKVGARVEQAHFDAVSVMAAEHRRPVYKTMQILHRAYYSYLKETKS